MQQQNFKNHRRFIPLWHYITSLLILAVLVGSIVNFFNSAKENIYSASLIIVISLILISIFWYARVFALKAQDRAIRAEQSLRYLILAGKPIDTKLRMSQIIALRFASDEEFVALAKKAAEENLSAEDIKKSIQNWKADYYRV